MIIKTQSVPAELQTDFRRIFAYVHKAKYIPEVSGNFQRQDMRITWYHIYTWTRKKGAKE